MRPPFAAALLCLPAMAAAPACAMPIGEPVVKEGIAIAAAYQGGVELDRKPAGMGPDSVHLEADVHATKGETHGFAAGAWMPYLTIAYTLTKDGLPTYKKNGLLYPMTAKDGPHYGGAVDMAGAGTYHLGYIVSPPPSHGMLRHVDKASGVPDWWKPILVDWTFNYPGNYPSTDK